MTDTGPEPVNLGVSALSPHRLDPFFSLREEGRGSRAWQTGLGLYWSSSESLHKVYIYWQLSCIWESRPFEEHLQTIPDPASTSTWPSLKAIMLWRSLEHDFNHTSSSSAVSFEALAQETRINCSSLSKAQIVYYLKTHAEFTVAGSQLSALGEPRLRSVPDVHSFCVQRTKGLTGKLRPN